jgi:acyl carrier protein
MDDGADRQRFQQWVVEVCREMGLPLENADDDFFDAGGNSLTAARLIERAEEEFGEDSLPPEALFESSSVGEIAAVLARTTAPDGA